MTVFLSENAANQIRDIIDYLELRWSVKVRNNFIDKLQRSIETIRFMPYSFPASQSYPGLRKCVITSQTTAFYRIKETEKEIIAILDSRQDFTA